MAGCPVENSHGEVCGRELKHRHLVCAAHSGRKYRTGSYQADVPIGKRWDPADPVGYVVAHRRTQRLRGLASDFSCVDCGNQAQEWSFNEALTECVCQGFIQDSRRSKPRSAKWSGDPQAYEPRCKSCHTKFDSLESSSQTTFESFR